MSNSVVGRWGKNLAIRVPMDVARASGLAEGETVEIDMQDGDLLVRRRAAHVRARQDAAVAAAEIIADSRHQSIGDVSLRDLTGAYVSTGVSSASPHSAHDPS